MTIIDDNFSFDKWLDEEMKAKGINKFSLARRSGLTHVLIAYYLAETRNPSLYNFRKLIDGLGMQIVLEDKRNDTG